MGKNRIEKSASHLIVSKIKDELTRSSSHYTSKGCYVIESRIIFPNSLLLKTIGVCVRYYVLKYQVIN